MAVLPTQPRRGATPGGMPDTGMQGQGRGAPTGLPKPMTAATGMPGMNDVDKSVPDPEDLVELFTAYTSGQLSREHLINQLDIFSEGQGGILGLLESMEKESVEGEEADVTQPMQAAPVMPGSVGPPQGAGLENTGSIPPLAEPLDKRHQRISMLLQQYGLPADDADQMSTVLNPNEEGVPYAWEQEQMSLVMPGDTRLGSGTVTKQGAFDAASSFNQWSDQEIWDTINTQYPDAPMTSADIVVDHTPRSQVSRAQGGTMPEQTSRWGGNVQEDDYEEQVSDYNVNIQPNIVWDPVRNQYIDTNRMSLLPQPGNVNDPMFGEAGPDAAETARRQREAEIQGGGAYGDMATAADTIRATPAINGGAYGDMGTAATNRAMEQGGGAYGDMATAADTVTQRNFPGAYGDAAWAAEHTPPVVPPTGPTISAEEYAKFKAGQGSGLADLAGGNNFTKWTDAELQENVTKLWGWMKEKGGDVLKGGGIIPGTSSPALEPTWMEETFTPSDTTGTGTREDPIKPKLQPTYPTGVTPSGQIPIAQVRDAEGQVININIGADGEETDETYEPKDIFAPIVDPDTGKSTMPGTPEYTGKSGQEDYFQSTTEPVATGFKTLNDFDFPELRGFLGSLADSARQDLAGQGLAGSIITALTDITNARVARQVSLANRNTEAAVQFLDRAALNLRADAQLKLEQGIAMGTVEQTATLARETEEYKQVMQRYLATGKVPQINPETGDFKRDLKNEINWDETLERKLSYDELLQDKSIRMSELFGQLINYTRTGELVTGVEGADPTVGMETLEGRQMGLEEGHFGLTSILKQSELAGIMLDEEGKPRKMTKKNSQTGQDEEVNIDTFEARRYAWEKDIATERISLERERMDIDESLAELEAATVQYGQQLTSHIESGRLAEAVTARKEKTIADNKKREMEKNQLKVSTLLSLVDPSTMLFAKRYGILDDIGAAIGVDFSGEAAIPEPPPMVQPGTYPTLRMLQEATPAERQIMMAETAAWGGAAADNASAMAAQERVQQWTPGSQPLRRGVVGGYSR